MPISRIQSGRRATQIAVFCVVVVGAIILINLNFTRPTTRNDIDEVKGAIENGIRLLGEACTTINHDNMDQYKSLLATYWGDEPVAGATLTVLWDLFNNMHPTDNANTSVEQLNAASTEEALENTGKATEIAGYIRPTPSWNPDWTLLQETRNRVEQCQQYYGGPSGWLPAAYGLLPFKYHSVTVSRRDADAEMLVKYWQEYPDGQGGMTRVNGQPIEYRFHLKRLGSQWKIVYQDHDSPTF